MKRDWFQILANVGVLIGLIVLIYEVRQSNLYAQAEIGNANASFSVAKEISVVGENLSEALARAMDDPDNLTTSELVVIDGYNRQLLMELLHMANQEALGVGEDTWEEGLGDYIRIHLDYPFGRKWWSQHRERMQVHPDALVVGAVIDEALQEPLNERLGFFQSLKSR